MMIKNYLKISLRNLVRNKNYTLLNICGLALGMTVAIFIALYVNDELSYNKYHDNYDHIAKVYRKNSTGMISQILTTGFGTQLKADYGSYFKYIALLRQRLEQRVISYDNKEFTEGGYFIQSDGPKMFTFNMIYGSRNGLEEFGSIIISQSLSQKLFGNTNPVNKTINMNDQWDLKVTGVYEDLPLNTEFNDAEFFAPLGIYLSGWSDLNVWDNYNMRLYVQLYDNADPSNVTQIIQNSMLPYVDDQEARANLQLFLLPMSDWHLNSEFENGRRVISQKKLMVGVLCGVGIFVLFLACINFINLSTACSEKRMKEIGIRKTLGSLKKNIAAQFLSESFIISIASFFIALFCVVLFLPSFSTLVSKNLTIPWLNIKLWSVSLAFVIFTAFLAGSYPAVYLASFNPVKALKGKVQFKRSSTFSRNILVIVQFTVSIIFIIASIVVYNQIQFAKDRPVGFSKVGLIALKPDIPDNKTEVLRNALKRTGVVAEMTSASNLITDTFGWMGGIEWEGMNPAEQPSFNYVLTDYEYCKTMGLEFLHGRDFSREFSDDYSGVIINESVRKLMGTGNPVGEYITCDAVGNYRTKYRIIGVVKDMMKGSPYDEAIPTAIFLSKEPLGFTYIRLNPDAAMDIALPAIEKTFAQVVPSIPFDYEFVDDIHNAKFKSEERIGQLAGISALLSLIISCLGIFGLSSFMVGKRTKEIGIRKVLGASIPNLLAILTSGFTKWVLAANLIAWPVAYYLMNNWLQNFSYRANINLWMFLLAGGVALIIAVAVVSFQTVKAASANPVKALKYE